ncbi:MAG: hypothetical protein DDT36_01275 [Firmicutes bacterium]|nr:hypothetical protein [Bacillota bacterium]
MFAVDEKEGTTKHKETIPSFDVFREKYPEILARYVALRALPPVTAGGALGVHVQDNLFLILDPSIR